MLEELKRFYNEHNIVCSSPFGEGSYRLILVDMWLIDGNIIKISDNFNDNDVLGILLINQRTNEKLIVEYNNINKMKILKHRIKFYMKDNTCLFIKY